MPAETDAATLMDAAHAISQLDDDVIGFDRGEQPPARGQHHERRDGRSERRRDYELHDGGDEAEPPLTTDEQPPEQGQDQDQEPLSGVDGDPIVEIPGLNGEVDRLPLSELIQAREQVQHMQGRAAEIMDRVEARAVEHAQARLQTFNAQLGQLEAAMAASLHAMPRVEPPDPSMLDSRSPNFNPDQYHFQRHQWEQHGARVHDAQRQLQAVQQQRQAIERQAVDQYTQMQLQSLQRSWPSFAKDVAGLVDFATETYGVSAEQLNTIKEAWAFHALRDAMAYRQLKAKGPAVKAVPRQQAVPRISGQRGAVSSKGADLSEAQRKLKKSGSIQDAASYFERLL